jgi:hypothetical protein
MSDIIIEHDEDRSKIISIILDMIKSGNTVNSKNYKMEYYYNLLEYIIDNHIDVFDSIYDKILLLKKLVQIKRGYLLMNKIINIVDDLDKFDIYDLLILASRYSCLYTFLLLEKKSDNKYNIQYDKILLSSIENTDDRVYKYVLNNYNNFSKILIEQIIFKLGVSTKIPDKIKLKKLKLLSCKIDLNEYFFIMIKYFKSINIIKTLHTYYYNNYDNIYFIDDIDNLLNNIENIKDEYTNIYNLFKTEKEKLLYIILCIIKFSYNEDVGYNNKLLNSIVLDNSDYIIKLLVMSNWDDIINTKELQNDFPIINILCKNNLFTKYFEYKLGYNLTFNLKLLRFTKFLKLVNFKCIHNYIYIKYIINNNYILHKLRIYVKRWRKYKMLLVKNNMLCVMNELLNYKPKNKNILKNGSYNYNLELQSFYNKDKFINANIDKKFSYNIIYNTIPYNTYPHNDILHNHELDVEYDKVNDIYIINDINISDMLLNDRITLLYNLYNTTSYENNKYSMKWIPNIFINKNNLHHHMQI